MKDQVVKITTTTQTTYCGDGCCCKQTISIEGVVNDTAIYTEVNKGWELSVVTKAIERLMESGYRKFEIELSNDL